jgi:hypothetical protein
MRDPLPIKIVLTCETPRICDWLLYQTEHYLMAVRGKPVVTQITQMTLMSAPHPFPEALRELYDLVEFL